MRTFGAQPGRLPIVGVMGSGSDPHLERAAPLGRWLADEGVHLLTGAGGGVMTAVSESFHRVPIRKGSTIGIIPYDRPNKGPKHGYPNPWVEIPIYTHLGLSGDRGTDSMSRNHINVLTSDVIVALPGGEGTASEVELALRYGRPIVAFVESEHEIPGLASAVPIARNIETVRASVRGILQGLAG